MSELCMSQTEYLPGMAEFLPVIFINTKFMF